MPALAAGEASTAMLLNRISSPIPTPQFNFTRAQFATWRTAVARVQGGSGRGKILCIGDSTTWGEGGGLSDAANNRKSAKLYCWPTVFAAQLASLGIPANSENLFGSGSNTGVVSIGDLQNYYKPGFNPANAWGISGSTTAGGGLFLDSADTNLLTYQPAINVDTFKLFDITTPTAGGINYNIDGGSNTLLSQSPANAFRTTQIAAGSPGTHTLNVARASGNGFLAGVQAWNSAVPQFDVLNIGRGSAVAADVALTTNPWSSLSAITALAASADLILIDLTINDAAANTAVAAYKASIQAIINVAVASGATVMLVTGNPTDPATDNAVIQQNFRQYYKDLAVLNNLPMVDQWVLYTSWAAMNARSFTFNARHPNMAGYADFGAFMGNTLNQWAA